MLDKSEALRVVKRDRKTGGPSTIHIFKCRNESCSTEIKVRTDSLKRASGFCGTHSHTKRPFESIYNRLFHDWRKTQVLLTYEEFLKFMKIEECEYCGAKIDRIPFATVRGKFVSAAYGLDKKDPSGPYSLENCVSCCTDCNRTKSNRFSYKEFLLIGKVIREILKNRGE